MRFFGKGNKQEVDSAQFFRQMGIAEEHLRHLPDYMIVVDDLTSKGKAIHEKFLHEIYPNRPQEIPQCPRCEIYTDDPEHYCGRVALVSYWDGPTFWYDLFIINRMKQRTMFTLEENRVHWIATTLALLKEAHKYREILNKSLFEGFNRRSFP